jgi:GH43 family beta-xylosidase
MKTNQINIRDPFVLFENGKYYMYGTRGKNFGQKTGGFDVFVSNDLENWSDPIECFNSEKYNMNSNVNWAPEVHIYKDKYYMFATFTKPNGLRGTYILKSDSPLGEFKPHSFGAVTPEDWECLDGTLYVSKNGTPFIVFCHEHTQIIDGTICYAELNEDLTETVGEVTTLFSASSPNWADKKPDGEHYVTDGPFMYRSKTDKLFMLWSTFIKGQYAECLVNFPDGELNTNFVHLEPLIDDDGGHGMIFKDDENIYLTFHSPNKSLYERPKFVKIKDSGDCLEIK